MKLLRLTASGLPLFKDEIDLTFYAKQRINEEHKDKLHRLFANIYANPVNSVIGINASGKTSVLKLISFTFGLLNNEPINHISTCDILGHGNDVTLTAYFYTESNNKICKLATDISLGSDITAEDRYVITRETLWTKDATSVATRKSLLDFDDIEPELERIGNEEFLPDDVSVIISYNKKHNEQTRVANLLIFTNANFMPFSDKIPTEIITFLDPTIESLSFESNDVKTRVHLKFRNRDEIILNNRLDLNDYLSSGTIKGISVFIQALETLRNGGYLIIDEIENHFNKEIASTLIRFFMDSHLNVNGGTVIYSTHYPELLDEFDRNDSIYITRNIGGITAENLSEILTRNDIKKSDAYQSGYLEGTTPAYKSYMDLKKSFTRSLGDGGIA